MLLPSFDHQEPYVGLFGNMQKRVPQALHSIGRRVLAIFVEFCWRAHFACHGMASETEERLVA